jgi:hypothetical protein
VISHSGSGAFEASLAGLADGFAIAWYDTRDGNPEIYVRLLDVRGRPQSSAHRLTNSSAFSYEADIEAAEGNLAVAWYEKTAAGALQAHLGLWTRDGRSRWIKTLSLAGRNSRNPVVRANGGEFFCAWLEDTDAAGSEVWAGWWDLEGRPLSPPRRLSPAGRTTWNLNATFDGRGRAWVVFDAKAGTRSEELFFVRTDKTSSEVVRLTADDGFASKYPDLVFGGDRAALTWFDERDGNKEVYLFVAQADDLQEGFESRALRVTHTPGESIGAYVAWNGRHFGLAWCDDTEGQDEVYFQSFDPDGGALQEPQKLTRNKMFSLIPAIRPAADGFALVWNEYTPDRRGSHESRGRSEIVFSFVR